jgi:cytochrome c oxidase subunit II
MIQADASAQQVDLVALVVLGITSFLALGVFCTIVWFLFRYRQGNDVDRCSPPETNLKLEIGWIGGALVLSMVMFFLGAESYYDLYVPPNDTLVVDVVGKQWMWKIRHPGGRREINRLHLPLGGRVKLKMISRDVIHSFYLPDFRRKHDVLPGRYTYLWLEPTRTGTFPLACSEYCGTEHAEMRGEVVVLSPEEYDQWAGAGDPPSPIERGEALYRKHGCNGCHEYTGGEMKTQAPFLDGIYGQRVAFVDGTSTEIDDEYLRRSILQPQAQVVAGFEPLMPPYEGLLTEEELLDLIAYIRSRSGPYRTEP